MWLLEKIAGHKHPCQSDMEVCLGLRSATDLSLPCFLSSSFAYQGLVNRLLTSLTLPHGEVINATDAWSALHDSSPWQKETQSAWDDLASKDVIQWPSWQLLLSTSCNQNHWCVWQVHCPLLLLSCLAKSLLTFQATQRGTVEWLQQRMYLAMVRGNTASILACVQVWSDFSHHHQCIN